MWAFNTVLKLVSEIGAACTGYEDKTIRNLSSKRIQCDETWSFCYAKAKNVPSDSPQPPSRRDARLW
jgi:hypothetical protein